MRRLIPCLLLASIALPPAAHAQINMAWNNCITEADHAENLAYACDGSRNGQPMRCVVSFISPDALTAFVGFGADFYVYVASYPYTDYTPPALPDFWRLGVGECRDNNIAFPMSLAGIGGAACRNPWVGANTAGGWSWTSQPNGSNVARLQLAFACDTPRSLQTGQQYLAGAFAIDTWGDTQTTDHAECPGCCLPVVISANQMTLYQVSGTPPQDTYVLNGAGYHPFVLWNSDYANYVPGCQPVPTRRATWGSIKATYR